MANDPTPTTPATLRDKERALQSQSRGDGGAGSALLALETSRARIGANPSGMVDVEGSLKSRGLEITDSALPYQVRAGSRLVRDVVVGHGAGSGAQPPGTMAVNRGGGVSTPSGNQYISAPQVSGIVRAPKVEGDGEESNHVPDDYPRCGEAVVAISSFQVVMPNGTVEVVPAGTILDDAGAVFLCLEQKRPVRRATQEDYDMYYGHRSVR